MTNLEFNNAELESLTNEEKQILEGGNPIVVGVLIYVISEDWANIKKGAVDAWNEYKPF